MLVARLPTAARPFEWRRKRFFFSDAVAVVDDDEEVALEPVSAREGKRPIRSAVGARLDAASSLAKI